jgi:hypothetical protein
MSFSKATNYGFLRLFAAFGPGVPREASSPSLKKSQFFKKV